MMRLNNDHDEWPTDRDLLGPGMGCVALAALIAVSCVLGILRFVNHVIEWMGR